VCKLRAVVAEEPLVGLVDGIRREEDDVLGVGRLGRAVG
jgi:hypothetical protein